ncbi:hypothetical protein TeGR_g12964, partial [Tetraparma gracilis]
RLSPPSFSTSYEIEAGSSEDLILVFTYDWENIVNSPVIVEVEAKSPFSTETVYLIVFSLACGIGVIFMLYTAFKRNAENTSLKSLSKEIRGSIVGIATNVADPATDYLNWLVVMSKCKGAISLVYISFVGISVVGAAASVSVNLYQLSNLLKDANTSNIDSAELEAALTDLRTWFTVAPWALGMAKRSRILKETVAAQ